MIRLTVTGDELRSAFRFDVQCLRCHRYENHFNFIRLLNNIGFLVEQN